jgi:chromosomal replication initiator protein
MRATWDEIKNQIKLELPKNTFALWIEPISFLEKRDKTIVLGCPNKFSRTWVFENYFHHIQDRFREAGAAQVDLVFNATPPITDTPDPFEMHPPEQLVFTAFQPNGNGRKTRLNGDYTFERFVVGDSNEFAYSAAYALARGDLSNYDTLLMLGSTGLGKTHLSQAAGHVILNQNPRSQVHYITAEDFTNEMISSIKNNCIEHFKDKYRRSCDVLLLDEVHFLTGKEKTQTELGYTLDALINDRKKIIFTSSLLPKDIPHISKGLSSRMSSGLVATINGPDYDTRIKILRKKAAEHNICLSDKVLHYLATHIIKDVRRMKSALLCLQAKSELLNEKIDTDLAKDVVNDLVSCEASITSEEINKLVCKYFKVDPEMLRSKSRKRVYAYPRNIYIYLCRHCTEDTLEEIAKTVDRSHSTVLYSSELVGHKMKTDDKMRRQVRFLIQKLDHIKKR